MYEFPEGFLDKIERVFGRRYGKDIAHDVILALLEMVNRGAEIRNPMACARTIMRRMVAEEINRGQVIIPHGLMQTVNHLDARDPANQIEAREVLQQIDPELIEFHTMGNRTKEYWELSLMRIAERNWHNRDV